MTKAVTRNDAGQRSDNHVMVLFGATCDLAQAQAAARAVPPAHGRPAAARYRVIGSAPPSFARTGEQFRAQAADSAGKFGITKPDHPSWPSFAERVSFAAAEPGHTTALEEAIRRAEKEIAGPVRRLYHLAVPPAAFTSVIGLLGATGLARDARVIIEKPFGTDLDSARALNRAVHAVFDESQIFRIDHFLGKESVDNILAFRFANGLFEPVWNRDHIRCVQIDVPETLSIEGRAAFYDATGAVVRAEVENWRWQGVPFFLRSGKAMGASRQVVTLLCRHGSGPSAVHRPYSWHICQRPGHCRADGSAMPAQLPDHHLRQRCGRARAVRRPRA